MIFRFTGHPFVDAGIAGLAAILEKDGKVFSSPEQITVDDAKRASDLLSELYAHRIAKEDKDKADPAKRLPLCTYLLQEVMPGSSWDQAKGKPESQIALFTDYIAKLHCEAQKNPIGCCFLSGGDAHLSVDKMQIPMLASKKERPNCYPNLGEGYKVSAWLALAILSSPLSIEKTVKSDGNGSECLIYHSPEWRFMVEISHRNLLRLKTLLASGSIDDFREKRYKGKFRAGTSKMALSTLLHTLNKVEQRAHPHIVIWNFNANNTGGNYSCVQTSTAFVTIHENR